MPGETLAGYTDTTTNGAKPDAEGEKKPSAYDDESMLKRVVDDTRRAVRFVGGWKEVAREDLRFAVGEQWTQEEKETLLDQNRPVLVINKIAVQTDLLGGYERLNSARIKVSPEGAEDKFFSEGCDKALAYVDKVGYLTFKQHQQFDDGIKCGKSVIEVAISYEKDPLHGDFVFHSEGPFTWYFDPDGREYDLSDHEFAVKIKRYTKAKLKAMFPKAAEKIEGLGTATGDDWLDAEKVIVEADANNYGLRVKVAGGSGSSAASSDEQFNEGLKHTLIEYWYKRYVNKWFIYDLSLERVAEFESKEKALARIAELVKVYATPNLQAAPVDPATGQPDPAKAPPTDPEAVAVLEKMEPQERQISEMWVFAMVSGMVLAHGKSPLEPRWSGFPCVRYLAYWSPSAETEEQRVQGIVRRMKDPQREINKARSQYLHILNTGANSGWKGDEDALTKERWKQLERFGSKPGITIKQKPGSKLDRIDPVAPSYANQLREKTATENMKEVTGINPDLLALEDKTVSGKALAQRVKQGLTIVAGVFENWRMSKRILGEMLFKLLPEVMDGKKFSRIVGQAFLAAHQKTVGDLNALLAQIEDGRYDVAITEATDSITLRQETFEQLLEIGERSGMPMPPTLMLKFSTVPDATEAAKEIEAYQARAAQQQAAAAA